MQKWKTAQPKYEYEIREIDAWSYEDGWTWNSSYVVGKIATSGDPKRAMMNLLRKKYGIVCKRGMNRIEYQGDIYELQNRKTGEPDYAAIPMF